MGYAKHFEKDFFVSQPVTVNEFVTIGVEPQQYPSDTIKVSIRSIKYTSNSKGIKIVSVRLHQMKNDFVGTLEQRENEKEYAQETGAKIEIALPALGYIQ